MHNIGDILRSKKRESMKELKELRKAIKITMETLINEINKQENDIFRGCCRQPLYCFHLDFRCVTFVRYIYIYI